MKAAPSTWRQAPGISPHVRRRRAPEPLTWTLAAAGPAARTWSESDGIQRALAVVAIVCLLELTHLLLGDRRWALRLAASVAAGAACIPFGGIGVAGWAVAAATVVDWAMRIRPPVPQLPEAHPEVRMPVGALVILAAWQGTTSHSRIVPIALITIAGVATWALTIVDPAVRRFPRRIGHAFAHVIGMIAFSIISIPLVLIPWVGQRIVRSDPFGQQESDSSWIERARRSVRPAHPWTTDSQLLEPPGMVRRRRLVPVALLVIALSGAALIRCATSLTSSTEESGVPPAFVHQPQAGTHFKDLEWYFPVAYDPTDNPRIRDARSTTINVRDGHRVSWSPPPCGGCRRVTLWFFGGSTGFGLGQRDGHTIASEVARLAWHDRVAVDVVNYGVPGDALLREAQSFAWDLEYRKAPDLAVFYDGINDMGGALLLQDKGCATRPGPWVDPPLDRVRVRDLDQFGYGEFDPASGPAGAHVIPTCDGKRVSTDEVAALAIDHYDRALGMSRISALAHGVEAHWYWQPSLFTKEPVDGEPQDDRTFSVSWWAAARRQLPPGVVDIADVLDDIHTPVFYDTMHHNELAARRIAEAIYADLGPSIRRIGSEKP